MLRGVGQQVVQDLDDALPVGHHPGQVRGQVDEDGVPAAPAQERGCGPGPPGLATSEGSGVTDRVPVSMAPGIQQVADQAPHVIGLPVDEAEELNHLGRGRDRRGAQHAGGGALDRGQGSPQLVADHIQELGPHPLQLHQRCQDPEG